MSQPLRIGLIMQGGRGWLGGSEYIKNIILALGSLPSEVRSGFEICLISSHEIDPSLQAQITPFVKAFYQLNVEFNPYTLQESMLHRPSLPIRAYRKARRVLLKEANPIFNAFLKAEKIDFIYPYFDHSNSTKSYRSAAWIYDFQHKYLPHLFTQKDLELRDHSFALMAQFAQTIVVSSQAAATDVQKFLPEATAKQRVLTFKTFPSPAWYAEDPAEVQQKYSLPKRFFLISNQFWQHKNHQVVFQALKHLRAKSIYPTVVCTGHIYDYRLPEYSDRILQTIHEFNLSSQVYLLGLIPRLAQIQLMRSSLAVIQPSLFEGWSTVVEDARCLGKPILLSDLPVHLEQNPPNSQFFEQTNAEHLAARLEEWWHQLTPGVNAEQEAIAKEQNLAEVEAFGYTFLKIAQGIS